MKRGRKPAARSHLRQCKICLKWKLATRDNFYSNGRHWLRTECIDCYCTARSETGKRHTRIPIIDGKRQCPDCGLLLEVNEHNFHRHGTSFQYCCKACRSKKYKQYRARKHG